MSHSPTTSMTTTLNTPDSQPKTLFGFWLYLMTDCVLFAILFATYAVLQGNTNGGPDGRELFNLPYVLTETIILLVSSFTCGLAFIAARAKATKPAITFLGITFALGLAFLALEITEFQHLAAEGNNWMRSGFLSAFFTLVGTHGLHISIGLMWIVASIAAIARKGFTPQTARRITMLSMFWHFLDVIWIFIFTIVYLMGVL